MATLNMRADNSFLMSRTNIIDAKRPVDMGPQHDNVHDQEIGFVTLDVEGLPLRFNMIEVITYAAKRAVNHKGVA